MGLGCLLGGVLLKLAPPLRRRLHCTHRPVGQGCEVMGLCTSLAPWLGAGPGWVDHSSATGETQDWKGKCAPRQGVTVVRTESHSQGGEQRNQPAASGWPAPWSCWQPQRLGHLVWVWSGVAAPGPLHSAGLLTQVRSATWGPQRTNIPSSLARILTDSIHLADFIFLGKTEKNVPLGLGRTH